MANPVASTDEALNHELENIIQKLFDLFSSKPILSNKLTTEIKRSRFFIWMFSYKKSSNALVHWKIYPPRHDETLHVNYEDVLRNTVIKGGNGTAGYILKSGKIEIINNTFLDPRGAVSYEDEIISNYSWAGIPLPLRAKDKDVKCVLSFFYQEYDFFNLEQEDTIKDEIINILESHEESIFLHNHIKELQDLNDIIVKSKKPNDYYDVLNEINSVLSVNSQFFYTGIFSLNNNLTFRLDNILFNTQRIENSIKDKINFCLFSKTKCIDHCIENEIHSLKGYSHVEDINHPQAECKIWKDYFDYLRPFDIYPLTYGKYKFIFYFSEQLGKIDKELIIKFTEAFSSAISNYILKLDDHINEIKNKDAIIKLKKRCTETIILIFQILIKALYEKRPLRGENTNIQHIVEMLKKSTTDAGYLISKKMVDDLSKINEAAINLLLEKSDECISNAKFYNNIIAIEFWELLNQSIQLNSINNNTKMNMMLDPGTSIKDIDSHSNISVIKRAIQEEKVKNNNGNDIFNKYTPLFMSELNNNRIIPKWNMKEEYLDIDSKRIYWSDGNIYYLHSLNIHPINYSRKVYDNIKAKYSEINPDNIYNPNLDNSIIKVNKNYFLFPKNFDVREKNNVGKKFIITGIESQEGLSDTIHSYAEKLHQRIEVIESERERKKHALKSAIAAIMSRNGSHNLGSHVLSAVSDKFNEPTDNQILFKYIQQRMDFIAQITTEFPQWASPTWFVRDLMRRFYMQKNILNYIAQSESLSAFEYQNGAGQSNKLLIEILDKDYNPIISEAIDNIGNNIKDVQVAVPGGVVGCHAFYTILENIIRNSTKHSWNSLEDIKARRNFKLYVQFDDNMSPFKDYVTIRIFDNCTYENVKKKNDINEFVEIMNGKIAKSFIEETGELRKENWGIAEIKISSGYLAKKEISEIGDEGKMLLFNEKKGTGIIKANIFEDKNKDKYFGYEFAIPKPREVLIIDHQIDEKDLLKINVVAEQQNIHIINSIDPVPKIRDYEFVIIDETTYKRLQKPGQESRPEEDLNIELLPYRLFIRADHIDSIDKGLERRICKLASGFLKSYEQIKWEDFKLKLYRTWIDFINPNIVNKTYSLHINTMGNSSSHVGMLDLKRKLQIIFRNEHLKRFTNKLRRMSHLNDDEFKELVDIVNSSENWISSYEKYKRKYVGIKESLDILDVAIDSFVKKYDEEIETLPLTFKASTDIPKARPIGDNTPKKKYFYDEILKYPNKGELLKNISIEEVQSKFDTYIGNNSECGICLRRHLTLNNADIKNNIYAEALSGSQFYFPLLESSLDEYNSFKLLFQIIENAFSKILIIDERVSEYFYGLASQKQELFIKGRLTIPQTVYYDSDVELLVPDVKINPACTDILTNEMRKINLNSNLCQYGFLIIHQGVLDKLWKNKAEIKKHLETLKKSIPFVIITSGRGTPSELPDYEKFIPFSDIKEFILKDYPEKMMLLTSIMKIVSKEKNHG